MLIGHVFLDAGITVLVDWVIEGMSLDSTILTESVLPLFSGGSIDVELEVGITLGLIGSPADTGRRSAGHILHIGLKIILVWRIRIDLTGEELLLQVRALLDRVVLNTGHVVDLSWIGSEITISILLIEISIILLEGDTSLTDRVPVLDVIRSGREHGIDFSKSVWRLA